MATEIGKLIATFEADISHFEKGRKQVESGMQKTAQSVNQSQKKIADGELTMAQRLKVAESLQRQRSAALIAQWKQQEKAARAAASGHKTFSQSISDLSTSVATLEGPLGGIAGRLSSLSSLFTGVAGPAAIAAAGILATVAAIAQLGRGLFDLSRTTAEFQGQFQDLAQQTGVSVETLSALSAAALTTGGSIESVTASLGIFQRNMEEALDTESKAAKAFQQLGVEVTTTEETLRDTLLALSQMPEGFQQTSRALELFGRGGKQLLAILKETNGDLDGAIEKLRGLGLVTTDQAKKADEFNDKLVLLSLAFKDLGTEAIPVVTDVLTDLQKLVKDNRDAFDALKLAAQGLTVLFVGPMKGAIFALNSFWRTHRSEVGLLIEAYQILAGVIRGTRAEIPAVTTPTQGSESGISLLREIARFGVPLTEKQDFSKVPGIFKQTGSGTKGTPKTVEGWTRAAEGLQRVIDQLNEDVLRFTENMERVSESVSEAIFDQAFAIKALESNTPDWLAKAEEFVRAKTKEGYIWEADTKAIYLNNAARLEQLRIMERGELGGGMVEAMAGGLMGNLVGSVKESVDSDSGKFGAADRAAELRDQYERHIDLMRELAFNLTGMLDRAIFDGFEGGFKRGFQSLTLGILDLVRNVFLKQLENALVNALSGVGGGGGGSLLGNIGKAVFGAILGGFAGGGGGFTKGGIGGGFAGKFQGGGMIPSGQWGIVHENERVLATPFGAQVIPSAHGGGSTTNTYIINVPVRSAGAYSSAKSRRQIAGDITAALQGSLA